VISREKTVKSSRKFQLNTFLTNLGIDPISAAKNARQAAKKNEGGYQKKLRDLLGATFGLAKALTTDAKLRKHCIEVVKHDGEYTPKAGSPIDLMRLACRYVFQANTDQLRDRCAKYARALAPYMNGDTEATEIPALIEENNGIDELARRAGAPARKSSKAAKDDQVQEDYEDTWPDDGDFGNDTLEPERSDTDPVPDINLNDTILLRATPAHLATALNSESGDKVRFTARNKGHGSNGLIIFRVTKVEVIGPKA
jgi:hypothetical protein